MGYARSWLMANYEAIFRSAQQKLQEKASGQMMLFGGGATPYPEFEPMPEWPQDLLLRHEKEALGFYITSNPVAKYQKLMELLSTTTLDALADLEADRELQVGGIISNVKLKVVQSGPRKGAPYVVFDLQDLTGRVEAIMFERDLERNRKHIVDDAIVLVKGTLDFRMDEPSLIARDVVPFDESAGTIRDLRITVNLMAAGPDLPDRLRDLLVAHPGSVPVVLEVYTLEGRRALVDLGPEFRITPDNELIERLEELVGRDKFMFRLRSTGETTKVKVPS